MADEHRDGHRDGHRGVGVRAMALGFLFLLPALQGAPPTAPPPPTDPVAPQLVLPEVDPPVSLTAGLEEMEALAAEPDPLRALAVGEALLRPNPFADWRRDLELDGSRFLAPALELGDPVFDWLGLNGHDAAQRGAVHYALGVVSLEMGDGEKARDGFDSARALAGPGELRLDASYNLGTTVLFVGEAARLEIPEISGIPPAPPDPDAAPGEQPVDPVELARAIYLQAKELLVERLRLDWRDADTRANVELVMRRLRELDEIERQREEQQQQEQQDQEDQQQDQQDQEDPNQDQEDQEQQDPEGEDPQEEEQPEEQEQEEQSDQSQDQEDGEGQQQEQHLTKEEVQRLLDKLKEYEREAEELRERMQQGRRRKTARDW